MPHVTMPPGCRPGIQGLFELRPDTAAPLRHLAETLLRGPSTDGNRLSRGERELIAAVVSTKNACRFCGDSHAAFASAQLEGGADLVETVRRDPEGAPIGAKLKALLAIALLVRESGKAVTAEAVARARAEGASDAEIHDTVLIAAAFCMFNRYVDGLATWAPDEPSAYAAMAPHVVERGYLVPRS